MNAKSVVTLLALAACFWISVQAAPAAPIAHWSFDADFSDDVGTVITSVTPTGPVAVTGADSKFGGGALATGAGDYLQTNPWAMGGSFTAAVWVKPNNIGADWTGFLAKNVSGGSTFWMGQHGTNGKVRSGNYFDGGTEIAADSPGTELVNGVWTHVAMTWNDDTDVQTLYLDGSPVTSVPRTGQDQAVGNSVMNIGRSSCCDFDGLLDEAWLFDEALSAGQNWELDRFK